MSSKVFISYSRRDRAAVSKIAEELDQLGQEVWLDEELSGGQTVVGRHPRAHPVLRLLPLRPERGLGESRGLSLRARLRLISSAGGSSRCRVGPAVPDQLLPPVLAETQRVASDAPLALARALLSLPADAAAARPAARPARRAGVVSRPPVRGGHADHLTVSEQRDLLGSIKQRLRDPEEKRGRRGAPERLRQHAEIIASVAEEIDGELAKGQAHDTPAAGSSTASARRRRLWSRALAPAAARLRRRRRRRASRRRTGPRPRPAVLPAPSAVRRPDRRCPAASGAAQEPSRMVDRGHRARLAPRRRRVHRVFSSPGPTSSPSCARPAPMATWPRATTSSEDVARRLGRRAVRSDLRWADQRRVLAGSARRTSAASSRDRAAGPSRVAGMRLFRRLLLALGLAGVVAALLRLRGTGGTPPQDGGWRELSGPDLR